MKPVNIPREKGENRGVKTFSLPIQSSGRHTAVLECYVLDMSERIRWKDRPAVILCPGGAYRFTNDRESEPLACAFLAEGYHVFSLRYSTEKGIYPAALEQLARTVRLVVRHMVEADNTLLVLSMPDPDAVPTPDNPDAFDALVVKANPNYDPHDA